MLTWSLADASGFDSSRKSMLAQLQKAHARHEKGESMRSYPFVAAALTTLVVNLAVIGQSEAAQKPNFVFINIDDLGYADIGPFGSQLNRTPHLDRMAAEGRKLTSFYAAPVCSPSRAAARMRPAPVRIQSWPRWKA